MTQNGIESLLAALGERRQSITVMSPNTGKPLFELPQFSSDEVAEVVKASRAAQPAWAATPAASRAGILVKLHDLLLAHETELLDLLQFETGKARSHAFEDFVGALNSALYYGKNARRQLRTKHVPGMAPILIRNTVEYSPIGVVGVITPWNYPLALSGLDVLPALAAGNSVVQKIDNQTALTALYLRKLTIDAGLPAEVWSIVVGDGAEVGNAITDTVDFVAFTGSTATGRVVAQRAAARLIGCSLELGGKNPMIVLPGADVRKAAGLALAAATGNSGQLCVSVERLYVHIELHDALVSELGVQLQRLSVTRSAGFDADLGSLASAGQLARVTSMLEDARSEGATVLGGEVLSAEGPFVITPAVVTNVPATARLDRSEVFGPVLQVYKYSSVAQAVSLANDTEFGLNASVVGPSRLARQVASQLEAGSVNINEGFRASFGAMAAPMGGFKQSGIGRRNGSAGLLRFTESRSVGEVRFWHLPMRGREYNLLSNAFRLLTRIKRWLP